MPKVSQFRDVFHAIKPIILKGNKMTQDQQIVDRKLILQAFQLADDNWQGELEARYGKDAGNARYDTQRNGLNETGTRLAIAYQAFENAAKAFRSSSLKRVSN